MNPDDPADGAPTPGLSREAAIMLANGADRSHAGGLALAPAGPLPIDIGKALAFLEGCMRSRPRVHYALGAKISDDESKPGAPSPPGFTAVDCSGFVRAAIRRSTEPLAPFPDGSVVQHDWVAGRGFASCSVDEGGASDDVVRIAFLLPSAVASGIGHVVLLYAGETLESHGSVGPDRRRWRELNWRNKTKVYRLT